MSLFCLLQASLVLSRTQPAPLRTQSYPVRSSLWYTAQPGSPSATPRVRGDEVQLPHLNPSHTLHAAWQICSTWTAMTAGKEPDADYVRAFTCKPSFKLFSESIFAAQSIACLVHRN